MSNTISRTASHRTSRTASNRAKTPAQPPSHQPPATSGAKDTFHRSSELKESHDKHSPVADAAHKLDATYQAGDLSERTFEQGEKAYHKLHEGLHKNFGGHEAASKPSAGPRGPVGTQPGKPGGLAGTLRPQAESTALLRPPSAPARPAVGTQPGQPGGLAGTLRPQAQSNSLLQRPGTLQGPGAPGEPNVSGFGKLMGRVQAVGGGLVALDEGAQLKKAAQHGDGQGVLNHGLGVGSGLSNMVAGGAAAMGASAVAGPACALGAGCDAYKDLHTGFTSKNGEERGEKLRTGGLKLAGAALMAGSPAAGPAAPLVFLGGAATYGAAWATSKEGRETIDGGLKAAGQFCQNPNAGMQSLAKSGQHLLEGIGNNINILTH